MPASNQVRYKTYPSKHNERTAIMASSRPPTKVKQTGPVEVASMTLAERLREIAMTEYPTISQTELGQWIGMYFASTSTVISSC